MSLYEISQNVLEAIESGFQVDEETGEVIYSDEQILAFEDFDEKMAGCSRYIKNERALIESIKAEEMALKARRAVLERRLESFMGYVAGCMESVGCKRYELPEASLRVGKSERVTIDETVLPSEFWEEKVTRKPIGKADLKKAVKSGKYIPGVEIVECTNLTVK